MRTAVDELVYLTKSARTHERHIYGHIKSHQRLVRADVAGRLLATDMLLACLKGKDVGALSTSIDLLKEGKSIGMFPQGTRHPGVDPETTKVRNGIGLIAATSGVKILPIYIDTKNNKAKLFRRRTVIIGKPITPEEINFNPNERGEYNRISNLIFERICQIGREYKQSKAK